MKLRSSGTINKIDFTKLASLGLLEISLPLFLFYKWILEILNPFKQTEIGKLIFNYLNFTLTESKYTKILHKLSNITLCGISICIIMTLIFTLRLYSRKKKLKLDSQKPN